MLAEPPPGVHASVLRRPVLRPPVALFDVFEFLFGQAEVVADLVDERFADRHDDVVLALAGVLDGALVQDDAIGQRVAVVPRALGERRALVQAEERVGRLDLHLVQQFVGRLVFDDHGDVPQFVAEPRRNRANRLGHQLFEARARHRRRRAAGFFAGAVPAALRRAAPPDGAGRAAREASAWNSHASTAAHWLAQRFGLADAASVQDQRVGGASPQPGRERPGQLLFDALGIVRIRDAEPVAHPQHVTVDRQPGNAERVSEHDVRRLASHAGQLDQRLHRARDLAAVGIDERPGHARQRPGFLPEEPGRVNQALDVRRQARRPARARRGTSRTARA